MSTPPLSDPPSQGSSPPATGSSALPAGIWAPALFFVAAGVSEGFFSLREIPEPRPFWPMWEALGRSLMHFLLALGLLRRIALCRSMALVFCLASIIVYAFALLLAFLQAPVRFPDSVVVQSVMLVPSCVILLRYLRSPEASALYTRSLF